MGQIISCADCGGCGHGKEEDEASILKKEKKNALLDIGGEIPPKPSFSRITTRCDPTNQSPLLRRAKLDRSKSEARVYKLRKVNIHARFRGRHGVFVADTIFDQEEDDADAQSVASSSQQQHLNIEKTEHEIRFIEDSLTDGDNFVFEFMTPDERKGLIRQMDCISFREGGVIIRQGDEGDYFYVIKEGKVGVYASKDVQETYLNTVKNLGGDTDSDSSQPEHDNVDEGETKRTEFAQTRSADVEVSMGAASSVASPRPALTDRDHAPQCQVKHYGSSFDDARCDHAREKLFGRSNGQAQVDVGDSETSSDTKRAEFAHTRSDEVEVSMGVASSVGSRTQAQPKREKAPPSSFDSTENYISREVNVANSGKSSSRRKTIVLDRDLPTLRNLNSYSENGAATLTPTDTLVSEPIFYQNEQFICDLGPGDTFGELALLYNCPRMATCVAKTPCSLWRVNAHDFRRVMAGVKHKHSFAANEFNALEALKKVTILSDVLDESSLTRMADALIPVKFKRGERICKKGDVGDKFYIVSSGEVLIHNIGHGDSQFNDIKAGPGDFFGERSLLSKKAGERRSADITAISDEVVTLVMSKEQFEIKLGSLKDIIHLALLKKKLMTVSTFADSKFEPHQFDALTKLAKEVEFKAGHTISTAGKRTMPALYFILSGSVQISNEKKGTVNVLRKDDHFGGEILHASGVTRKNDPKAGVYTSQTIEVMEPTKCAILTRHDIEQVIGSITRLGKAQPPISAKLDRTIKHDDLIKHRILGIGSFGSVWLVTHRTRKSIYALKIMRKKDIIKCKLTKHVIREKNIMISVDHPLIVNIVTSFQDVYSLYMVQNFIQGGELFTVIHTETSDGVSNDAARFYIGCILESLSHLHKRNICYRDLKPENVLIDKDGYCILIDLGFAKLVLNKTHTLCGTPEYLAPELILHKGHNREVDDWALGVLLYEMIVGQSPFASPGATEVTLFRKIVAAKFPFPDKEKHGIDVSDKAKDLIRKLIKKNPCERLGSLAGGDDDIKNHPYFEDMFKNDDLKRKQFKSPWVPALKDAMDASHFETFHETDIPPAALGGKPTKIQQSMFAEF